MNRLSKESAKKIKLSPNWRWGSEGDRGGGGGWLGSGKGDRDGEGVRGW